MFEVLTRGFIEDDVIGRGATWPEYCSTDELHASYVVLVSREQLPANQHTLGKLLSDMFQPYRPRVPSSDGGRQRRNGYRLGTLADARDAFKARHGIGAAWSDDDAEDPGRAA